ncbi:hypothetical protein PF011_g31935 [Phytophthora fragariae]|uniref:DUF6818 domain-containing protein n=1 Tax=Phytophthora fragariae TaxID=53985 RepID=A0A6A3G8V5_9STRA|nr:hypothetical protein PF011_g31935 [Phytophthora fragariae]
MARRGRRPGYHNYSTNELMLLCTVADKHKPLGRNMWEAVALEYNSRRSRNWLERDYDSLRRKFQNLPRDPVGN